MANSRKDNKGRVLWKGETYRKSDGKYQFTYQDESGKRHCIYAKDLSKFRKREEELTRDRFVGISSHIAKEQTLNEIKAYQDENEIVCKSNIIGSCLCV